MIRYEVQITGHEAPYDWRLMRDGKAIIGGKADSIADAVRSADKHARDQEWHRQHALVKQNVLLFEVPTDGDPDPDVTVTTDMLSVEADEERSPDGTTAGQPPRSR